MGWRKIWQLKKLPTVDEEIIINLNKAGKGENNNATVAMDSGKKKQNKLSRADKFRHMVAEASLESGIEELDLSSEEGDGNGNGSSSGEDSSQDNSHEDGEAESSDAESYESVKILPRSKEQIDEEQEEYRKAKEDIIEQAADCTLDKLATFLKAEGLVMTSKEGISKGKNKSVSLQKRGGKNHHQSENEVGMGKKNGLQFCNNYL